MRGREIVCSGVSVGARCRRHEGGSVEPLVPRWMSKFGVPDYIRPHVGKPAIASGRFDVGDVPADGHVVRLSRPQLHRSIRLPVTENIAGRAMVQVALALTNR